MTGNSASRRGLWGSRLWATRKSNGSRGRRWGETGGRNRDSLNYDPWAARVAARAPCLLAGRGDGSPGRRLPWTPVRPRSPCFLRACRILWRLATGLTSPRHSGLGQAKEARPQGVCEKLPSQRRVGLHEGARKGARSVPPRPPRRNGCVSPGGVVDWRRQRSQIGNPGLKGPGTAF